MAEISALMIVKNEAHNIEEALSCLTFAKEVIVIDSYSTDNTVTLARKHPTLIFQRAFDAPGKQKNWGIEKCTYPWIFVLDADERLEPSSIEEILEITSTPTDFAAFDIRRQNYFLGKKVRFSAWQNDSVVRLFKNGQAKYNDARVHENLSVNGTIGQLQHKMIHHTCQDLQRYKSKLDDYAMWKALDIKEKTGMPTWFHFNIKPAFRFVKHFVIQLGFLDGKVGYQIAKLNAHSVWRRYQYLKQWKEES